VKLIVFNVNCPPSGTSKGRRNPALADTLAAIPDADVVLLQEIAHDAPRSYPYRAVHADARAAGGLAVLSRLPIELDELIPTAPDGWFPAQRLIIGGVQILHVHLRPALDEHGWATGYMSTPPIRLRQIQTYWNAVVPDPPAIVAGDFNEEPTGTTVGFLAAQGLARVVPDGPKTWHYVRDGREVLALDIDHVMIDRRLRAEGARVLDVGSSDHRPIEVTISRHA
jgi:endonuclease/exonuclease/phosphatase family metal-dependent hydrolase